METNCRYDLGAATDWSPEQLRALIREARNVVVVGHQHADGDAVGSVSAIAGVLGHFAHVTPMLPDGVPDDLRWFPGSEAILDGNGDADRCRQAIAEADLIVAVDMNGFDRAGCLTGMLFASKAHRLLVDHHEMPVSSQFDAVVSDPEISSACELVYWLASALFGADAIDRDIATCLYAGICTDTGTFAYSNTHPSLYLAAADLVTRGIDPMYINRRIKNVFPVNRMRFFGYAVSKLMTVYLPQQVALLVMTREDMDRFGVDSSEMTGLINEVMRLRDIDCGVLIREEADSVRLSFRSKERYDVNVLARELFTGGGHVRAAGATSHLSLEETVVKVKQRLQLEP